MVGTAVGGIKRPGCAALAVVLVAVLGFRGAMAQEPRLPPNDPTTRWVQTAGPPTGPDHTIEIDARTGAIYAAAMGGALFKSTDGETWSQTKVFTERFRVLQDIMIERSRADTLYVFVDQSPDLPGSTGEIFKSTDGAQTWTNTGVSGVRCAALSPIVEGSLVAGSSDGRVSISEDGGETWTMHLLPDIPLDATPPLVNGVAAGSAGEFWVCPTWTNGELLHSTDSGASWQKVATLPANQLPAPGVLFDILVDPNDSRRLYVTFAGDGATPERSNVIRTDDGGQTWTNISVDTFGGGFVLAALDSVRDTLYVAAGLIVWKTSDRGATWTHLLDVNAARDKLRYVDPKDLAVDPAVADTIYLPSSGFGIGKTTDGGETWRYVNTGLRAAEVSLIDVIGHEPGGLISNGDRSLFRSLDWGQTWEALIPQSGGIQIDEVKIDRRDPQRVWIATDVGEMYVSADGGDQFTTIFQVMPPSSGFRYGSIYAMERVPVAGSEHDRLYAVKAGFGIWRSDDGGERWRFLKQSLVDYTYTLAVDPANPDVLFAGHNPKPFETQTKLHRTRDGGDSWDTPLVLGEGTALTSVAIDPDDTTNVFAGAAGSTGGLVFRSADSGDTWQAHDGLSFANVRAMASHPVDPAHAIAALWGGGLYTTTDSGMNWVELREPPTVSAATVMITPADPPVYYVGDRTAPRIYEATGHGPVPEWALLFDAGASYRRLLTAAAAPSAPTIIYASMLGTQGPMSGSLFRIDGGVAGDAMGNLPVVPIALAVHPADADTVYACLHGAGSGVFKTTDGGNAWSLVTGPGSGIPQSPALGFNGVVVNPAGGDIVYLFGGSDAQLGPGGIVTTGADPADLHTIYRSTNGGASWTNLNDGNLGAASGAIKGLAVSPANADWLFAGAREGVFRSTNGGASWARAETGLSYRHLAGIGLSSDGVTLYGPTAGGGMHVASVDTVTGEPTWSEGSKLSAPVYHVQLAVDPTDGSVVYATAYPGGIFKSTDGGANWREHNFGLPTISVDDPTRQGYYALSISPSSPNILYLGIYRRGVYRSDDGGATWLFKPGTGGTMAGAPIASLLIDPTDPEKVYAATEDGVFLTTNGRDNWIDFNPGLANRDVRVLRIESDGDLLAGTRGDEVYRYPAAASSWEQMPPFADLGNPWLVWARGLYQFTSILFHPSDPATIYIGTFPTGIYKSEDGGQTWREHNVGFTNDGIFYITFHPDDPDTIYAGTYNGVNRSIDGGLHWEVWDEGWPDEQWVFDIEFDPRDARVMYACSKNGENKGVGRPDFHGTVMKSVNGGEFWQPIASGLTDQEYYGLELDPEDPDVVYLAAQKGFFISRNGGESWEEFQDGLTNPMASHPNNVTNPLTLSSNGQYLFLGSAGSGLYRRRLPRIDDWRSRHFEPAELADPSKEATVWGDVADPDGDQLVNIVEYRLGLNPRRRDELPFEVALDGAPDERRFMITYTRPKHLPGANIVPESSPDLWSWSTDLVTEVIIAESDTTETIRASIPLDAARGFLRLRFGFSPSP